MSDKDYETLLASHRFFKAFDRSLRRVLCKYASERQFDRGDVIFTQDEVAVSFFLILEGEIEVQIPSIYGPPIVVQTLGPNEVLGWSWLFPPYKWNFEARAAEDSTVLEFSGDALRTQCEEDPKMGYEFMKQFASLMAERLQAARMRVMEVCAPPEAV